MLLLPFLILSVALIYNSTLFMEKLGIIREEISVPNSEQNTYLIRLRFLSSSIRNSHDHILLYLELDRWDLLESEMVTMEGLKEARRGELQKLKESVIRNGGENTSRWILLQQLETQIAKMNEDCNIFLAHVDSIKKGSKKEDSVTIKLAEDLSYRQNKILNVVSAFLLYNQKELEESSALVDVLKVKSLYWAYFILALGSIMLIVVITSINHTVSKSLENIKCPPKK